MPWVASHDLTDQPPGLRTERLAFLSVLEEGAISGVAERAILKLAPKVFARLMLLSRQQMIALLDHRPKLCEVKCPPL